MTVTSKIGYAVIALVLVATATPAAPPTQPEQPPLAHSVFALPLPAGAGVPAASTSPGGAKPPPAGTNEHPLQPLIRWAQEGLPSIEAVRDYSATFVKRERVDGQLREPEYLAIKVRHKPFSVYADFLAPAKVRGQEAIYVEGQNNGNLWAHRAHMPGTFSIRPDSVFAMNGNRYPLTEIGLVNLVRRLLDVAQQDVARGACQVQTFTGTRINQRSCTMVQVVHPERQPYFRFHLARIFVDDELRLPVRYESHGWPQSPGGAPELIEEYTYLDLRTNQGFTDEDFNPRNPRYRFR